MGVCRKRSEILIDVNLRFVRASRLTKEDKTGVFGDSKPERQDAKKRASKTRESGTQTMGVG